MAPVTPDPAAIKAFPTAKAFERWLRAHHASAPELWLRIYKKGSGLGTVTAAEALDIALCWGSIDGLRKSLDEVSFLQRYTPRRPKSMWSQVNRDHVARLTAAGRMTPNGQRQVDAARADGRWDAAYAPIRSATIDTLPEDSACGHRRQPSCERHVASPRPARPVRARLPDERDEDARGTGTQDCGAGRAARTRVVRAAGPPSPPRRHRPTRGVAAATRGRRRRPTRGVAAATRGRRRRPTRGVAAGLVRRLRGRARDKSRAYHAARLRRRTRPRQDGTGAPAAGRHSFMMAATSMSGARRQMWPCPSSTRTTAPGTRAAM